LRLRILKQFQTHTNSASLNYARYQLILSQSLITNLMEVEYVVRIGEKLQ
jgi:hypothetical protein